MRYLFYICKINEKVLTPHSFIAFISKFRLCPVRQGRLHVAWASGSFGRQIRKGNRAVQCPYPSGHHRLLEFLFQRHSQIQSRGHTRSRQGLQQFYQAQSRIHERISLPSHHPQPLRRLRRGIRGFRQGPEPEARSLRNILFPRSHQLPRTEVRQGRGRLRLLYQKGAQRSVRLSQQGRFIPVSQRHFESPVRLQSGNKAGPLRARRLRAQSQNTR